MRIDISYKYMEKSGFIDNVLDKNLDKISKRILMFKSSAPVHISIHLEKNPHREQYFCRTHIYLPARMIKSEGKAFKVTLAVNKAFAALAKQLAKVKYRVEKHLARAPRIKQDIES